MHKTCLLHYVFSTVPYYHLRKDRVKVPNLVRDLARNLIGSYRVLIWLLSITKVETRENKRERDPEPQAEEGQHGGEGNSSRGMFTPDEEVEKEPNSKYYAWI